MSLTPEEAYFQLGNLVAELPDLATGPITPEMKAWLRREELAVPSFYLLGDAAFLAHRAAELRLDVPIRAVEPAAPTQPNSE